VAIQVHHTKELDQVKLMVEQRVVAHMLQVEVVILHQQ
jgi:hypothetical protein